MCDVKIYIIKIKKHYLEDVCERQIFSLCFFKKCLNLFSEYTCIFLKNCYNIYDKRWLR